MPSSVTSLRGVTRAALRQSRPARQLRSKRCSLGSTNQASQSSQMADPAFVTTYFPSFEPMSSPCFCIRFTLVCSGNSHWKDHMWCRHKASVSPYIPEEDSRLATSVFQFHHLFSVLMTTSGEWFPGLSSLRLPGAAYTIYTLHFPSAFFSSPSQTVLGRKKKWWSAVVS